VRRFGIGKYSVTAWRMFWTILFLLPATGQARANPTSNPQFAAVFELPKLPSLSGASVDWRQWDSFFTFVVKQFGQEVSGDVRDSLAEVFLDSRYELTSAVAPGQGGNPVPQLFLNSWRRLSPVMNKALPQFSKQTASQYSSFIAAADRLAMGGQAALQTGLISLSPDVLTGMARLIAPSSADNPLAYTTNVDASLRGLLGFGSPLAAPGSRRSRLENVLPPKIQYASMLPGWEPRAALAAAPGAAKLDQWVPEDQELQGYLTQVRGLLTRLSEVVAGKNKLVDAQKATYRQIVFAAAWQESCWRQFIKKGKSVTPLASATGDVGLMQVNRNTWRSLYDLKGLGDDIEYNGNAGGEILAYYLTRYAMRKNEDKQEGGNLARATYAAYNGGPSHLTRYRSAKQNPALKKVDEAFWEKYQAVSAGREMDVQLCYQPKK
jgi:transglycosylase-like protein with SLT domain